METEELIEHILRQKHLEEMMNRPEKEHTPLEGMDNEQIKRFALFLFEENQNKSRQLDEMIARLDEIGKDLKEARKNAYEATEWIQFANKYMRHDIGKAIDEAYLSCIILAGDMSVSCLFLGYGSPDRMKIQKSENSVLQNLFS